MGALPKWVLEKYYRRYGGKFYRVVIGIPSYNNAETIGYVASVANEGLMKFFDGYGIIVNSDGGSTDGTKEAFMKVDTQVDKESFEYIGIPGKGSAMKAIFEFADLVNAEVIVFLDADLRSAQPWWIERLAKPIVEKKADYVTPYYVRHKYDATITNHICYPLTSMLYGMKVRQPIGGDFGVGRNAYKIFLERPIYIWETNVAKFGIDIWMTTTAIVESGRIYQAALGAKVHDVKDPGKHLGPMFLQVVSTLFDLMVEYKIIWKSRRRMEKVPVYGEMPEVALEEIEVDVDNLKKKASESVEKYEKFLKNFVDETIIKATIKNGILNTEEWIKVVFSFACEYKESKKSEKEHVVEMLIPFYFARVAKFVEDTKDMDTLEAEKIIEEQLESFVKNKETLIEMF